MIVLLVDDCCEMRRRLIWKEAVEQNVVMN
jgi:hypothetical protein